MNFLSQVDLLMIITSFIGSGCLLLFHLIVFVPSNTQSEVNDNYHFYLAVFCAWCSSPVLSFLNQ